MRHTVHIRSPGGPQGQTWKPIPKPTRPLAHLQAINLDDITLKLNGVS